MPILPNRVDARQCAACIFLVILVFQSLFITVMYYPRVQDRPIVPNHITTQLSTQRTGLTTIVTRSSPYSSVVRTTPRASTLGVFTTRSARSVPVSTPYRPASSTLPALRASSSSARDAARRRFAAPPVASASARALARYMCCASPDRTGCVGCATRTGPRRLRLWSRCGSLASRSIAATVNWGGE